MHEYKAYQECLKEEKELYIYYGLPLPKEMEKSINRMQLYFIRLIGKEENDFYRYEFFFADNANASLVENYDYKPCCLNKNIKPIVDETTVISTIKTRIKLSFIQDSCCMSYKNAIDQVVAIAWESLDGYDEYPQDGRLVFHFGEEKEDIERKLALKNILMMG